MPYNNSEITPILLVSEYDRLVHVLISVCVDVGDGVRT